MEMPKDSEYLIGFILALLDKCKTLEELKQSILKVLTEYAKR